MSSSPVARTPALDPGAVSSLCKRLSGQIVLPGDDGYPAARRVWNGMIDRFPAIVARCRNVEDVRWAMQFALDQELTLSVRGGGHSVAGFSTCDGGLVLDLGPINSVTVDPISRTAIVGGGALLSDLDAASQQHCLACPVGVVGHTGVGGLTLGGGLGRIQRKHGYTIDNLLAVDLLTGDSRLHRVDAVHEPDLFWGLRGAGANFGIVTSFQFQLHPIGPTVVHGFVVYPAFRAHEVAARFLQELATSPDEVALQMTFRLATASPPLDAELEGKPVAVVEITHYGPVEQGLVYVNRWRQDSIRDSLGPRSYLGVQLMHDEPRAWGHRFYMKNCFFSELPDEVIAIAIDRANASPGECTLAFMAQAGVLARIPEDATAFTGRGAAMWCSI